MTMTPRKLELVLRPAEERDVPAIQQIAREAWDETYGGSVGALERQEILGHLCSRRSLLEDIGRHNSFFFVAALEDGVVGFAEVVAEGRSGEVARVAVLPDWQRRGVATSLLRRGLAALAAAGAREVTAAIEIQDVACRQLFERNGFEVIEAPVSELEELDDLELVQLRRAIEDAATVEAAAEATVWVEDGQRPYPRGQRQFETVLSTSDESRLSFVESALEGAGIVYVVHEASSGGRPEEGLVEIQVAESRVEEAREVLDALETVEVQPDEE